MALKSSVIAEAIKVAKEFIKERESYHGEQSNGDTVAVWDDYGKVWTIGWGNTSYQNGRSVKQGDRLNSRQADELLEWAIAEKEKDIRDDVKVPLNYNQYAALISLAYNCGQANVENSKLLQLINSNASKDEIEAQYEKTCVTAKGVYVRGLFNRRAYEIKLFFNDAMNIVRNNPELSMATGFALLSLIGYYIIKAAKNK